VTIRSYTVYEAILASHVSDDVGNAGDGTDASFGYDEEWELHGGVG
jgi:hypothetical protein